MVAPSLKVTVPVGTVVPAVWATVAVSVVLCPKTEGLTELVSVVVVGSCTFSVVVPIRLPLPWQPLPLVPVTVIVYEPGGVALAPEAVVVMWRADVFVSPPTPITEAGGLGTADAPVGRPETEKFIVHEVLFPPKTTLMV